MCSLLKIIDLVHFTLIPVWVAQVAGGAKSRRVLRRQHRLVPLKHLLVRPFRTSHLMNMLYRFREAKLALLKF
jgi:hypothetical protein